MYVKVLEDLCLFCRDDRVCGHPVAPPVQLERGGSSHGPLWRPAADGAFE